MFYRNSLEEIEEFEEKIGNFPLGFRAFQSKVLLGRLVEFIRTVCSCKLHSHCGK